MAAQTAPLAGIRVLDFTAALAGPQTTFLLGALGAEVIKVEAPGGSDMGRLNPPYVCELGVHFEGPLHPSDISVSALSRLRNKQSVTIDAKVEEGRALLRKLVPTCDVFVHNFRQDSIDALGLGYAAVRELNPEIVYCAVTAFGGDAIHGKVGMDVIAQALSGLMGVTGEPDGAPMRVGIPISDFVAPLYAVIGIFSALRLRDAGLGGRIVEVSMLDVMTSLIASEHFEVLEQFGMPIRTGNSLARMGPFGVYRSADGHVAIAASQDPWCHALYRAMGRPDLVTDPRFGTRGARVENSKLVDSTIDEWTSQTPTEELVAQLLAQGVPVGAVRTPAQALADPGVRARGAVVPLVYPATGDPIALTGGLPIRISETEARLDPVHDIGSDTERVLSDIGISPSDIRALREQGVIG